MNVVNYYTSNYLRLGQNKEAVKLSYKKKSDYESLPLKIEKLEQEIEKNNNTRG